MSSINKLDFDFIHHTDNEFFINDSSMNALELDKIVERKDKGDIDYNKMFKIPKPTNDNSIAFVMNTSRGENRDNSTFHNEPMERFSVRKPVFIKTVVKEDESD